MKTSSPLRYPGGKSALSGLLSATMQLNTLEDHSVAEPFSGGAGASLTLLFSEETHKIHINDADRAIYDFWWTLVNRPNPFLGLLSRTRISMAEWRRQRSTYRQNGHVSRLRRAFAAFYLNRCNRSGIIMNGGPIGGVSQKGEWKLGARFNKSDLRSRCKRVAEHRHQIEVSCEDGIEFIGQIDASSTFLFVDPPYFNKGPTLYLNALDEKYHRKLAARLRSMSDAAWILTYDDCPEVRKMYRGWATIRPFSLRYAASERRAGKEVLIAPRWMRLPLTQRSAAVTW